MDKVTEASAVLSPKRRVSSDTLMTGSLTLEPPIVARRVRRSTRHQSRPLAQKDVCRAFTCDVLRAFIATLPKELLIVLTSSRTVVRPLAFDESFLVHTL